MTARLAPAREAELKRWWLFGDKGGGFVPVGFDPCFETEKVDQWALVYRPKKRLPLEEIDQFTISLPPDMAAQVVAAAKAESRTISELFREAFRVYRAQRITALLDASQNEGRRRKHQGYSEKDVERLLHEVRAEPRAAGDCRARWRALDVDQVAIPDYVEDEVVRVLVTKFQHEPCALKETINQLLSDAMRVRVRGSVAGICRDRNDDAILETAVVAQADLVVAGDRDLLKLKSFQGIAIVTPADYLRIRFVSP